MKYDNFGQFFKNFLETNNYTLEYVAKVTGSSFGAIGHYANSRRVPSEKFIENFVQVFHFSKQDAQDIRLLAALDRMPLDIKQRVENACVVSDKLIGLEVQATISSGCSYLNFSKNGKKIYLNKNGIDESCYLIGVQGNSMEPVIPDGSFVVIDPRHITIENNKIYIVKFNDEIFLKKVSIDLRMNLVVLKSVNTDYTNIYVNQERTEEFELLGKAIQYFFYNKL